MSASAGSNDESTMQGNTKKVYPKFKKVRKLMNCGK